MSSTGYTPVFGAIYDGTLCGKWPAAPLFASLLPLCDARGYIDMSPQAISSRTGWPMNLLLEGLAQLQEPDEHSRSSAEEGRRLVLIDPTRKWGWRVINHAMYREKARLMAKNAREVESGYAADRMRAQREGGSASVRRSSPGSPQSAGVPLSYSDSNTDTGIKSEERAREAPPDDFGQERPAVPRGTADDDTDHAWEVLAEMENAWRDAGCDVEAMEAWLAHCATFQPPKVVSPSQRISIAKMLFGMGTAEAQRKAVQFCAANGFRNLRHADAPGGVRTGGRKTFDQLHAGAGGGLT